MVSRALALRPVHSVKNVVDIASSVVLAVPTNLPVIEAVDTVNLASPTEVPVGSTIKAIYLRAETIATNVYAGVPRVYMAVYKNPATQLGFPAPNSIGNDERKRFVIHQEMIMVGGNTPSGESAFPRTVFQGVIRIPPRMRRFGHEDKLYILFQNGASETTGIANVCVQVIYKWFT